jgi:hypothetical protein
MFVNTIPDNGWGDHDRVESAVRAALGARCADYEVWLTNLLVDWHISITEPGGESWEYDFHGPEEQKPDFVERKIAQILSLRPPCDCAHQDAGQN